MADGIFVDLEGFEKFNTKTGRLAVELEKPTTPFKSFGVYMVGEIRKSVAGSVNREGKKWLGLKWSSIASSTRSQAVRKNAAKKAAQNPGGRAPVSAARPLVAGSGGRASRSTFRADNNELVVRPTMQGDGKVGSLIVYHHGPELTGGPSKRIMPEREFHYLVPRDEEFLLALMERFVQRAMDKAV